MSSENIEIYAEATPNPLTMKFVINRQLTAEPVDFTSAAAAERSPLASKIFGFPWAAGVFLGRTFVTVTRQDWVGWDLLADPLAGLIKEHLESGEPILLAQTHSDSADDASPEAQRIRDILDREIRPSVALDGGDIVFHKYENHKVYLYMRGACSGCPSSTYTLKMGIETRLKEAMPEIEEVIAL